MGGSDRVTTRFAEDAVVCDEGRDIHGRGAIRAWAAGVRRKHHFHDEVATAEEVADRTCRYRSMTGDFLGNPVDLSYRFRLAGLGIIALVIS